MAANLGTAWIQVKPSMNGVRGSILNGLKGTGASFGNQMGNEVKQSKGMTVGMAAVWGAASGIALKAIDSITTRLTNSIDTAIKRVDTLNNANRTFANMGFSAKASQKALDALNKSILGLPTPLDSAVRGMTSLAATYSDVSLGQKVFSALNNAILGFGGTTDMVNNAILQLSQLPMDGPLDAQTWNSLRNSGITPVLVAMAKESGISVSEMKKQFGEGELKVQDFIDRLIDMNVKGGGGLKSLQQIAKDSTKGIGTSMENANTAISRGIAAIINALGASGISDAITASGARMESVLQAVAKGIKLVEQNSDLATSAVIGLTTAFAVSLIPTMLKAIPPMRLWSTYAGLAGLKLANFAKLAFLPTLLGAIAAGVAFFVISSGGATQAAEKLQGYLDTIGTVIQGVVSKLPSLINTVVTFITQKGPEIFKGLVTAVQQAAPAVLKGAVDLINSFIDFLIQQGPSLLQTFNQLLTTGVQGLTGNISKFAAAGTQIIVSFLDGITAALPSLIKSGVEILNNLINSLVSHLPAIINAAVTVIEALVDGITANLPTIIAAAILIITALLNGLISVLPQLIDAALQIVLALANALLDNLPQIINAAINLITALVTALLNNLPMIINAAVTLIVALVNGLIGALPRLIQAALQLILAIAVALIANLPLIIGAAIKLVIALAGALIQMIPKLIGAALQLIWAIVKAIVGMIPNLVSAGFRLIAGLFNGIVGSVGKIGQGIGQIVSKIVNTIGNINLFSAGKDIVQGLWNGISNMAGWIGEKIKGFGDGVLGGIKNFFGIKSPSRVMRDQVGEMLGLGMAEGIKRSTRAAVKSAQTQAGAVLDAFGNLSSPTLGIQSNAQLALAGAAAGGQTFNITNPDPEQTAQIVANRMKNQGGNL